MSAEDILEQIERLWVTESLADYAETAYPDTVSTRRRILLNGIKEAQIEAVEKTKAHIVEHLAQLGNTESGFLTIPALEKSIEGLTPDQILKE